jgi:Lon protease-like protein
MSQTLPLFPLGTVLFPGVPLPLRVFEQRYRQMVRDLLKGPAPGHFGVVAIRKGRETGADGISALYEIGCTAALRQVEEHDDGTFGVVCVGTRRFRLVRVDNSLPYLRGEVEQLAEDAGDEAAARAAARAVQEGFRRYLDALAGRGVTHAREISAADLPGEPAPLSYLVAALMTVDLPHKQALLAEPDALRRLNAERALLARETAMLRAFTSTPAPDLRYSPYNPN